MDPLRKFKDGSKVLLHNAIFTLLSHFTRDFIIALIKKKLTIILGKSHYFQFDLPYIDYQLRYV